MQRAPEEPCYASAPQRADRCRKQAFAERHRCIAIIEHEPLLESITAGTSEPAESAEVVLGDRRGRLDLDPDNRTIVALEDQVDFVLVLVAIVMNGHLAICPGDELGDL